jgi:Domain of unknown function (DUF4331)
MSHHFDSPSGREDPRLNLCDLFLFAGQDATTVMVMTVNPEPGLSSPTELRDEGLYEFKFDTDSDAQNEVPPTRDFENAGERIVANVVQVARLTGSVAEPQEYGRFVADRVLPDILP